MVSELQLTNADFEKVLERPSAAFQIWRRRRDNRVVARRIADEALVAINADGFGNEPIAVFLTLELADIVSILGQFLLAPALVPILVGRLNAIQEFTVIVDPGTLGIV